ncbi:hypothetical protein Sme01_70790 [Sphaerisporangium melleum]|uniref:HTH cro/C1-type domain-containing protein n=2 Tax=Sphaerisporangium melleum TaxID=321316 RepID=A0A917RLG6_9ACTN|nr:hypothetical protein GCM10007964_65000 [Sphaerisporangium melleum]GII74603.1 hypothetical protein Sme01_70790 [Sphaerisporangium melleum]
MEMPRGERPLDDDGSELTRFAADLRLLRVKAGSPPYRELAKRAHYSPATLADAAAGRRLPSLAVTRAYVRACDGDAAEWEARWHGVAAGAPLNDRHFAPGEEEETQSPYVGLAAFQVADTGRFFGRERLTDELLTRVRDRRLLVVFGASGVGKSSLLRAGLLTEIGKRSETAAWSTSLFTPGPHPLDQCAAHLAALTGGSAPAIRDELGENRRALHLAVLQTLAGGPDDEELLVVVDQFEEIFTLCRSAEERRCFIEALVTATQAANSRTRVVLGVRADFYARCAEHPELEEALQEAQLLVGAMSVDELRRAITQPAVQAGCAVESALLARIIADAVGRPSTLPLVSHALRETWRRRRGNTLTLSGYERVGGVHGAITATAEQLYNNLTAAQAQEMRRIFLRLIVPGEHEADTRRPASYSELIPDPRSDAAAVLEQLAAARLLTMHEGTVELAHEALIVSWPRLGEWIDQERHLLRVQRRLTEAAASWQELGRDPGALYQGARLDAARLLLARAPELTPLETAFLRASLDAAAQTKRAGVRRRRLARLAVATLSVMALTASAAAMAAVSAARRADAREREALARLLVLRDEEFAATDPVLSGLLAAASWHFQPTAEARHGMLSALSTGLRGVLNGHSGPVTSVTFSPDGTELATAGHDGTVRLWDAATRRPIGAPMRGHGDWINQVVFSPDGTTVASAGGDGTVRLWDTKGHHPIGAPLAHSGPVTSVAFSRDGTQLVTVENGVVRRWDVATRGPVGAIRAGRPGGFARAAFSPNGTLLATSDRDGAIRLRDTVTYRLIGAPLTGDAGPVASVAFSPDGTKLATAGSDGNTRLWDIARRHVIGDPLRAGANATLGVAFSPDGSVVATAGGDGSVQIWDVSTHRMLGSPLKIQSTAVITLAFSPDGTTLATAGADGTVRLWDVGAYRALSAQPVAHTGSVQSVAFSPTRGVLASAGDDGTVRSWDANTHLANSIPMTGHTAPVRSVAFSPNGAVLASAGDDGTVRLWNAITHRPLGGPLTGHTGAVRSVAFTPNGDVLASAGDDRTVRFWDVATHRPISVLLTGHSGAVRSVAFSPSGSVLASAGDDRTVRLWDAVTHRPLGDPLTRHIGSVASIAFNPQGTVLASAASNSIQLWDVATQRPIGTPMAGHTDPVTSVRFNPQGTMVASAASDGIRLWDLAVRRQIGTPLIHSGNERREVREVAFNRGGTMLAGAGQAGNVFFWRVDVPADPFLKLCAIVKRSLTPDEWRQHVPGQPFQRICP